MKTKTDCQMYDKKRDKCRGLNKLYCNFENCKFYKKENEKSDKRKKKR